MRRSALAGAVSCLAFACAFAATTTAEAGPYVGLDFDLGTAFRNDIDLSYGLGGRIGYKADIGRSILWILPEASGHYMRLGPDAAGQFNEAGTVTGGARLGFRGIVQPNIFGHLGLGFVGNSRLGPAADVGVGVDFRLTHVFLLGAAASYNAVTVTSNGEAAKWLALGINMGFNFDGPHAGRRHRY